MGAPSTSALPPHPPWPPVCTPRAGRTVHPFLPDCTRLPRLELESGVFFNMNYFEDLVVNGKWDEIEKYLAGFTDVNDNRYSMKIYFEIRKQKYLEALDR